MTGKKRYRSVIAVLGAIALLAACGSDDDSDSSGRRGGGGGEGDPIQIGAMFDTTGPFAGLGVPMRNSFELTLEQINADGGINGRPLEATIEDSETSPDRTVEITRTFVRDGLPVIIGPTSNGGAKAAQAITEPAGIVTFAQTGGPIEYTPHFFTGNYPPELNLTALPAAYFESQGWSKVACIQTADAAGDSYSTTLEAAVEQYDLDLVATESFQSGDTDVSAQLSRIRDADPDVIFSCNSGSNLIPVLQGVRQLGMATPVFAGNGSTVFPVVDAAVGLIPDGGLFSVGNWMLIPDEMPESYAGADLVREYIDSYSERFDGRPDVLSASAVDSLLIVAEAMRQVDDPEDGDQVAEAIEGLQDYQGLLSSYSFSPDDHRGSQIQPLIVSWTNDGNFTLEERLDPEQIRD